MRVSNHQGFSTLAIIGIVVLAAAVIAVGFFVYQASSQSKATANKAVTEDTMMEDDNKAMADQEEDAAMVDDKMVKDSSADNSEAMVEDDTMMENVVKGYVDYNPDLFAQAEGQTRILFFHASWCPTCKIANQELITRSSELPAGVVIFKTDYDSRKDLKAKYGVTYQHTFVQVDAQGNLITKWNGGGVSDIINRIK